MTETEHKTRKKVLRSRARRKAKGIALSDAEMRIVYAYCEVTGNQYWTNALRNVGVASMAEKLEAMGHNVSSIRMDPTIEERWPTVFGDQFDEDEDTDAYEATQPEPVSESPDDYEEAA